MEVQVIPRQERTLRVAAYCRVSTARSAQHESFETQCRYYTRLITSNPNWAFAGIYADEGLSATTTRHRKEFMNLMDVARHRMVDLILVKSVSRFSRNSVDCNMTIQELKSLQVEVRFEKEGISTFDPTAEFLFNVNAIVAQEVSRSTSRSIQWRVRKDYEQGIHHFGNNMVFGYDVVDRQLVPNGDAWVIQRIFADYVSGMTCQAICEELASIGAKGLRGAPISPSRIRFILRNPIYVGDLQLQKQAPRDFLTKKPAQNVDYNTYYITDDHEGIVDRGTWEKARERMRHRGMYPHFLDGKVFCGCCGAPYRRVRNARRNVESCFSWECREKLKGNSRGNGCKNPGIREKRLLEELCGILQVGADGLEAECDRWVERVVMADGQSEVTLRFVSPALQ